MTKLKYIIPTIIAVAIVIISTISIIQYINRKRYNPVKVLNEVKSYFMNVKGSYIVYEPFVHPETDKYRLVYQGGITTIKNGQNI
ncbi:TPA: peptidase, partial [Staphylococcus aureus]|nr:peptidase [Staphylococcus aureus]